MSFAELLTAIEAFDLEGYLLDHGFSASRHGEEWVGTCPGCSKDKLCVDIQKRGWHCWVCQAYQDVWSPTDAKRKRRPVAGAGGVLALVQWLDGLDQKQAIQFVRENGTGLPLSELPELPAEQVPGQSGQAVPPPECASPILAPLPYMTHRRISMEDVRRLGLFACHAGKYANRLIFPVYEGGQLVYWQARAMWEPQEQSWGRYIKVLNPERTVTSLGSSDVLMNLDQACHFPRVAVTEGPMDCLRAGPSAVCSFGKVLSTAQICKLYDRGVRAVDLMWDGPKPGDQKPNGAWQDMIDIAPTLSVFFDVRLVFLPHGDPADWDPEALALERAKAIPARDLSRLATL